MPTRRRRLAGCGKCTTIWASWRKITAITPRPKTFCSTAAIRPRSCFCAQADIAGVSHGIWGSASALVAGSRYHAHEGRLADLLDVVNHYDQFFALGLTCSKKVT